MIMNDDIKIIEASMNDYPIIQNMARFYVYDLSRECGFISKDWAIADNGLYESFDLKCYIEEAERKAYLIKISDELAGFVMLNKITMYPETQWNMGEYFVVAKFQRKGFGNLIIQRVLQMHPGQWEVSIIPENKSALNFWRRAILNQVGKKFKEAIETVDYDSDQPQRVILSFNTTAQDNDIETETQNVDIKRNRLQADDIRLDIATLNDYTTIQNMTQFYVYDVSRECGFSLSKNGLFELHDYIQYIRSDDKSAYMIRLNHELAGFVLLSHSGISSRADFKIDQFFVLAKFQGKGLGEHVVHKLLQENPGQWELTILPDNKSALAFWQKVIGRETNNHFKQENITLDGGYVSHPSRILIRFNTLS